MLTSHANLRNNIVKKGFLKYQKIFFQINLNMFKEDIAN